MSAQPELAPIGSATSRRPSLRSNFSWTFAGNISNTLSQFGVLLALAKIGDTEKVGQYGLGLAITTPVFLLAGMSLRNVLVTDANNQHPFRDYVLLRIVSVVFAFVVVAILVGLFRYSRETALVVLIIALSKLFDSISDIIFGYFQKYERMDSIARSMIGKAIATVVVFTSLLYGTNSLIVSLGAISVVWAARLFLYDLPNILRMTDLFGPCVTLWHSIASMSVWDKRNNLASLAKVSLPVAIAAFLISLNGNVPRYIIDWYGGTSDLGIYTVLTYPLVAGNTVASSLSQASLPRLSRYFAENNPRAFYQLLLKLQMFGAALGAVAVVMAVFLGEWFFRTLFGDEYADHRLVLIVLTIGLALGLVNWFLNSALHAMRAFHAHLWIQSGVLLLTLVTSLVMIPWQGLVGAAAVSCLGIAVQIPIKYWIARTTFHQ